MIGNLYTFASTQKRILPMLRIMIEKFLQLVSSPRQLILKNGKKSLLVFGIYFVTKWGLTLLFGQQILEWIRG